MFSMRKRSANVAAATMFYLCDSKATATMFCLCESEATATMFYLRESEASAAKRPVGTEINPTLGDDPYFWNTYTLLTFHYLLTGRSFPILKT
ncbi:hypothetical protein FJQ98_08740 [Lysinibacillus agricola]|uniref:Secreted protein n=1 Tax=Lysinibacillus agricola TaxID=2590012 RepID=A0ABX7B0Y2_9BACI|nr:MULTISPECIES: hypothetical protein [Lysinibacillus]QQP14089.1 hypothetical protein FJQ98_08740 [Lysinibacillus agricola]